MGGLIIILLLLWGIPHCIRHPRRKRHRTPQTAPVVTAADLKQIERERKQRQRRELAEMELDHGQAQRERLMAEAESLENSIREETGEKRLAQLRRRLEQIDEKLYRIDMATAKAYNIVKYGG